MPEEVVVEAPVGAVVRKVKLPRGFARTKGRLDRAIKEGATLTGLLGKQAHIGGRIRKGEGVRRSSLKAVERALDTWEAKKPIRMRAARSVMRPKRHTLTAEERARGGRKAAGSVSTFDVQWMVKMYLDAAPEDRKRFRTVIEALEA